MTGSNEERHTPKTEHWYNEDVWLVPVGPNPHFNRRPNGPVEYRVARVQGAELGFLWFRDEDNAAGFTPRRDYRTLANNAGAAWSLSLLRLKQQGLCPSEAITELTARGGTLLSGELSRAEPLRTATSLASLEELAGPIAGPFLELGIEFSHSRRLATAFQLADHVHAYEDDKADDPYILHSLRVALAVENEQAKIVAILHDVLERTTTTLASLRGHELGEEVVEAVDALTRRKWESSERSIDRLRGNFLAMEVKRAEIADNLDEWRLSRLPEPTRDRLRAKYLRMGEILAGLQQ